MQLRDIASVAILFVISGIVLGIGAQVLNSVGNTVAGGSSSIANNTIRNASAGLGEMAGWLPTIGLVIAAALIITIIFSSFGGKV